MEAAGLPVGILALVGVFNDCVDLFSYISAAKSLARDYELLNTKLDLEKLLLLQWAQRVGLAKEEYDSRLDDPTVSNAVSRILAAIQLLLSDSRDLRQRYGLEQVRSQVQPTRELQPKVSKARMEEFLSDFKALKLRTSLHHVSTTAKIRWAVRDREKFNLLVQDLAHFVAKLDAITPASPGVLLNMTKDDVSGFGDRNNRRMLFNAARGTQQEPITQVAHESYKESCEEMILRVLHFSVMDDRRHDVVSPEFDTFQWIFQPDSTTAVWDPFPKWLSEGSGIYWISGKAGSGKSTLMKYLYQHQETTSYLRQWSKDMELTCVSFFFWNLGSDLQKSHEGLMRALLYQILSVERSLIPLLLPTLWETIYEDVKIKLRSPTPPDMLRAFQRFSAVDHSSSRFCLFIDGLDEFSGRYQDAIKFIEELVRNPCVKVVVSSRPIASCVAAFSNKPMLRLQDLTLNDISAYIKGTIGGHSYLDVLRQLDDEGITDILRTLVEKASGVFLWVVLACRSLLEGFDAYDGILDLKERINELPQELEDLFRHILTKIEPRYQPQAAKLLRLRYLSHKFDRNSSLPILGLALIGNCGSGEKLLTGFESMTSKEKCTRCVIMEGQLRSRCWGLLEPRMGSNSLFGRCTCGHNQHTGLMNANVEFLHKTVFEFLGQPHVWELDCLRFHDAEFDSVTSLAALSLSLGRLGVESATPEVSILPIVVDPELGCTFQEVLCYAQLCEHDMDFLDRFFWFLAKLAVQATSRDSNMIFLEDLQGLGGRNGEALTFSVAIALALELEMEDYIRHYLLTTSLPDTFSEQTVLRHAFRKPLLNELLNWGGGQTIVDSGREGEWIDFIASIGYNPDAYDSSSDEYFESAGELRTRSPPRADNNHHHHMSSDTGTVPTIGEQHQPISQNSDSLPPSAIVPDRALASASKASTSSASAMLPTKPPNALPTPSPVYQLGPSHSGSNKWVTTPPPPPPLQGSYLQPTNAMRGVIPRSPPSPRSQRAKGSSSLRRSRPTDPSPPSSSTSSDFRPAKVPRTGRR